MSSVPLSQMGQECHFLQVVPGTFTTWAVDDAVFPGILMQAMVLLKIILLSLKSLV